jgi:hypothetical protein
LHVIESTAGVLASIGDIDERTYADVAGIFVIDPDMITSATRQVAKSWMFRRASLQRSRQCLFWISEVPVQLPFFPAQVHLA